MTMKSHFGMRCFASIEKTLLFKTSRLPARPAGGRSTYVRNDNTISKISETDFNLSLDNKKIPKIKGIPTSWHWGTQPLAVGNYLSFRDKTWAFSKIKKGYATWCTTLLFRFRYISSNVLLISCICGVSAESLPVTSVVTCFWQ